MKEDAWLVEGQSWLLLSLVMLSATRHLGPARKILRFAQEDNGEEEDTRGGSLD